MISLQTIQRVVATIVAGYKPERIILFGSCATGDPGEAGDLDLFIVKDTLLPPHRRAVEIQAQFREDYPCAMDLVVYTPTEVDRWKHCKFSFVHRVLKTGRVVYG